MSSTSKPGCNQAIGSTADRLLYDLLDTLVAMRMNFGMLDAVITQSSSPATWTDQRRSS
jgi:hypothetical protein